jgi:hypothetical protein
MRSLAGLFYKHVAKGKIPSSGVAASVKWVRLIANAHERLKCMPCRTGKDQWEMKLAVLVRSLRNRQQEAKRIGRGQSRVFSGYPSATWYECLRRSLQTAYRQNYRKSPWDKLIDNLSKNLVRREGGRYAERRNRIDDRSTIIA